MTTRDASETLTELADVSQAIARLEARRDSLVAAARSEQLTWQAISEVLGVSRQAAWKAHRTTSPAIARVRARSGLDEAQAMQLSKAALREAREVGREAAG